MTFELTILGSSSATPAFQRNPAAQVLNIHEKLFLIDCGEATQIQLSRYKIKSQKINHIFISHLHGDHYLGLMGLLSSFHLNGREATLHIYCFEELKEILDLQFKVSNTKLSFTVEYHFMDLTDRKIIFEDKEILVESIRLNHRVPCVGFLFKEKPRPRNVIREKISQYNIPYEVLPDIKSGKDFTDGDGNLIKNSELTIAAGPPGSFAYCSDTLYDESILSSISGIDLLYHEATFLDDMKKRAAETFHSTSVEAAQIASKAGVNKLIIGHFSARYKDLQPLLDEARSIFPNTFLAVEGEKFQVR